MKITLRIVAVTCSLLTSACSSGYLYEEIRSNQRHQCNRLPGGSERDECREATAEDYEAYKRKRDEHLPR